jgi:hypothetical protein
MPKRHKPEMTGEDFEALPDREKERIWQEIDSQSTEELLRQSRPLNARERQEWRAFKKKLGRPRVGKGTTNVSVSMEKGLLKKADRFAKAHGMSRSELVANGVKAVIGSAA